MTDHHQTEGLLSGRPRSPKYVATLSLAGSNKPEAVSRSQQISAAVFYGVSSIAIMFVNKIVLTSYKFPSFNFLALSQFAVTAVILLTFKHVGKVGAVLAFGFY